MEQSAWSTVGSLDEISLESVRAVAADVDHTVFDFDSAHEAAVDAVSRGFGQRLGCALGATFDLVLAGSRMPEAQSWDHRAEFNDLLNAIAGFQPWAAPGRVRKWARASWMQVANERDDLGMSIDDIAAASDAYWMTLGSSGGLYPDVEYFLRRLEEGSVPLVLMTASDSVLKPEGGGFVYDSAFAHAKKTERLALLGIPHRLAVIGDPYDKPSKEFFDLVDEAVLAAGAENVGHVAAVGDSFRGDVEVPAVRGYKAYLIDRK